MAEANGGDLALRRSIVRRRVARLLAIGVDALQIVVFPIFFPGVLAPLNNVVDAVTGIAMVLLLGWHVAFLPTFIAELIPFVDLFPSWTLAVLFVTRRPLDDRSAAKAP